MKFIASGTKVHKGRLEISPEEILKLVNDKLQDGKLESDLSPEWRLPVMKGLQVVLKSGKTEQTLVFSGEVDGPLPNSKIVYIDEPHDPNDE